MRIALIAPEFLPNWGGIGTYCVELVRSLANIKGIDIHVITLDRLIKDKNITYTKEDMINYFERKVKVHILTTAKDTFLYNAKFQYQIFKQMPKLDKEFRFDLLHSQHAHMSDVLYKIRKKRINSLTTIHTTIKGQREGIKASSIPFTKLEASEKWQTILYYPLLIAEKYSMKKCNHYITVSNWMKNELLRDHPYISRDMTVIHNGVDTNRYSQDKAKNLDILSNINEPIILFSSRMTAAKGAHFLIDAIPKVLKENKELHFVFAGAGPIYLWRTLIKEKGIDKKYYSFLGYINYDDLPKLYANASIYILPSLYENFPIRMLEAMSCGIPVIASKICAIPEAIDDGRNGILISPRNSEEIAESILALLDDESYRKYLGKNARNTMLERFSWKKIADKTFKVYKYLVEA